MSQTFGAVLCGELQGLARVLVGLSKTGVLTDLICNCRADTLEVLAFIAVNF